MKMLIYGTAHGSTDRGLLSITCAKGRATVMKADRPPCDEYECRMCVSGSDKLFFHPRFLGLFRSSPR